VSNPRAFENATAIIDLVPVPKEHIDLEILHRYLDVALGTDTDKKSYRKFEKRALPAEEAKFIKQTLSNIKTPSVKEYLKSMDAPLSKPAEEAAPEDKKRLRGERILSALRRANHVLPTLVRKLDAASAAPVLKPTDREYKAISLKICQRMQTGYDMLVNGGMAPRAEFRDILKERSTWAAMVGKQKDLVSDEKWQEMKRSSLKTWKKQRAKEGLKVEEEDVVDAKTKEEEVPRLEEMSEEERFWHAEV
jgi:hypothetical protein